MLGPRLYVRVACCMLLGPSYCISVVALSCLEAVETGELRLFPLSFAHSAEQRKGSKEKCEGKQKKKAKEKKEEI